MSILNFIKNLIKSDTPNHSEAPFKRDPNTFDFHEDYYCQIEFLPKENFNSVSQVATEISELAAETFDGYGWKTCYVRKEANVPTKSKNISVADLASFLKQDGFWEYPKVTTGYSSKVVLCEHTRAFKKQSIIVCFDARATTVENIWQTFSPDKVDNELYKSFLLTMAEKYNFLLADWWKSLIVDISNSNEIDRYFEFE